MSNRRVTALVASLTFALSALAGCSSGPTTPTQDITVPPDAVSGFTVPATSDKGGKDDPVRIGVVGAGNKQFQALTEAAAAEGIWLKFQDFTDYAQLNPALADQELDLNQFQHIVYLAKYNVAEHSDLAPIGATAIYPLGLYSSKYGSPAEIPAGSTIAVPDDQTNQARGLQLLAANKLITLRPGTLSLFAEVSDIDTTSSAVKVIAIAADQTPRSLDDPSIAAAVINNDYIADTGLAPQDAIAQDDPASEGAAPYINVWVAKASDKALPLYAEIVRLAHTPAWNEALQENSGGTAVLVDEPQARLQQILDDAQKQLTA
ncbi:MAG: methionine ABC transporter substrate-binding protein [Propionibacteriaceae bacterium]|jgi:D-methionine transport system substrate-binding protein|nr:methionine ABC transporter substrate-binding protein [Propionibacteriaceae bacterium]